jgi:hypothetical protein
MNYITMLRNLHYEPSISVVNKRKYKLFGSEQLMLVSLAIPIPVINGGLVLSKN